MRLPILVSVPVLAGITGIFLGFQWLYVILVIIAVPITAEIAAWILNRVFASIYKEKNDPDPRVATTMIGVCVVTLVCLYCIDNKQFLGTWQLPVVATGVYISIRAFHLDLHKAEIHRTVGFHVYSWFKKLFK